MIGAPPRRDRQHRLDRRHALDAAACLCAGQGSGHLDDGVPRRGMGTRPAMRVNAVSPGYTLHPGPAGRDRSRPARCQPPRGQCRTGPPGGCRPRSPRRSHSWPAPTPRAITGVNLPVDAAGWPATPWNTYGGLQAAGKLTRMLEVKHLSKSFGGVKAIQDVTLAFADGSLTAVIGPNGAGKSTFFNLITGGLRPDLRRGRPQRRRPRRQVAAPRSSRAGIGRAFQIAKIFPSLTVRETLLSAVTAHQRPLCAHAAPLPARRHPRPGRRGGGHARPRRPALDTLSANLSHGDQKLLDIALALVLEPRVLLLDEPTAGMGPDERWRMIDKVYELWEAPEDHAGLHRARHGHRVQDRADRSGCCATAASSPKARPIRSARIRR